jgi:hypothetical protein
MGPADTRTVTDQSFRAREEVTRKVELKAETKEQGVPTEEPQEGGELEEEGETKRSQAETEEPEKKRRRRREKATDGEKEEESEIIVKTSEKLDEKTAKLLGNI